MDSVKNFKYNSSQQPMFSVIETTLNYTSFAQNNSAFKDLSFTSSLKPKNTTQNSQENEIGSTIDDTEISIFDAQKYFSESNDPKDVKKQQQQRQQQQQHEASHDLITIPRQSSVSSANGYGRNFRTRSFNATPTASSEASWNSQTGLLANPPGSIGVSLKNFPSDNCKKRSSGAKKWFLIRKSCCIGKKSIQVKEVTSDSENTGPVMISTDKNNNNAKDNFMDPIHKEKATPTMSSHRSSNTNDVINIHQQKLAMAPKPLRPSPENNLASIQAPRQQRILASGRPFIDGVGGFSFPVLNTSTQATKPALEDIKTKPHISLEDPPRESLEIFQAILELSSVLRPGNPSNSRTHFNPGSPISRVTNMDDDICSNASSDLFEIESLSTPTSYPMYHRRDSIEEAPTFNARRFASAHGINANNNIQFDMRSLDEPPTPSVAATECYAPSEVSIDWSVTTAEGFDKASVTNFSVSASEIGNVAFLRQRLQQQEEVMGDGGKRKGNGLLLMGCRQEKAVSVGPQPVKCVAEGPPIFPLHVGGRPPRANKPPQGSSNAARLSLAFAA